MLKEVGSASAQIIETTDSAGGYRSLDFNRFNYHGVPLPKMISSGKGDFIKRSFVGKLFTVIKAKDEEGVPGATLCNHFNAARRHVIFSDNNELFPFTKESVEAQVYDLHDQQRQGKIKDKTETCRRGDISALLQLMELPAQAWLPQTVMSGTTQQESAKGYSRAELKRMLPLLRTMFKQFAKQYQESPAKFDGRSTSPLSAQRERMTFRWQEKEHLVCGGVSKMFSCAVYLMSYYTWANTSVLFSLERPRKASYTQSEQWYQMPAFKRRAFKTVSVEMGAGESVEVPKYALQFFDELLKVSEIFWGNDSQLLFGGLGKKRNKINSHTIKWLCMYFDENFTLRDDRGAVMRPRIGRFRATGGDIMIAKHGVAEAALALDNTPNTVRARYSSGNPSQNTKMLSDAANVLYHSVKTPGSVDNAKKVEAETQGVDVLTYEDYLGSLSKHSRTAHGGYCKTSKTKDERYTKKARNKGLLSDGEQLACADLKACFDCDQQVLIESVDDIWCILSFKECIEESMYLHQNTTHFVRNYADLLEKITSRLKKISTKILKLAESKLLDEGRHPIWQDGSDLEVVT
jgi:hypothetical protein